MAHDLLIKNVLTVSGNDHSEDFRASGNYSADKLAFLLRELLGDQFGDMSDDQWDEFVASGGAAAVIAALFSVGDIHDYFGFNQAQRQEAMQELARGLVNGMTPGATMAGLFHGIMSQQPTASSAVDSRERLFAPYTPFATLEDAILAWALTYHALSTPYGNFPIGSEWGTWIYRHPGLSYYTFGREPDHRTATSVSFFAANPAYDALGFIHTHPTFVSLALLEMVRQGIATSDQIANAEHFSGADASAVGQLHLFGGIQGEATLLLVSPLGVVSELSPEISDSYFGNRVPRDSPFVSIVIANIFATEMPIAIERGIINNALHMQRISPSYMPWDAWEYYSGAH